MLRSEFLTLVSPGSAALLKRVDDVSISKASSDSDADSDPATWSQRMVAPNPNDPLSSSNFNDPLDSFKCDDDLLESDRLGHDLLDPYSPAKPSDSLRKVAQGAPFRTKPVGMSNVPTHDPLHSTPLSGTIRTGTPSHKTPRKSLSHANPPSSTSHSVAVPNSVRRIRSSSSLSASSVSQTMRSGSEGDGSRRFRSPAGASSERGTFSGVDALNQSHHTTIIPILTPSIPTASDFHTAAAAAGNTADCDDNDYVGGVQLQEQPASAPAANCVGRVR